MNNKHHHRAKRVIDLSTGKEYNSAKEAATAIGISWGHMVNQLNGNADNKTTMIYAEEINKTKK